MLVLLEIDHNVRFFAMDAHPDGPIRLNDFLEEAELEQYCQHFRDVLKITKTSQLKYVNSVDLRELGLSKPEQRRYKKLYTKYFGKHYLSKIKRLLTSSKKSETSFENAEDSSPIDDYSTKIFTKHIIPVEDITINKELGTGEFGVVQQGTWTNNNQRIQVAIKCLGRERMNSNSFEFLKEAAVMHSIEHTSVVRLYGVVLHLDSLMLVTELAPLRSLLECLKEFALRENFPVQTLCNFAEQICDGMSYLESKRLIHRDLAARNILVFNKNKVKISDFGLSRALGVGKDYYQTNYNVNLKLPVAWCAAECITYLRFTSSSDVWAYAVTLWEMFSYGFQPWAAFSGHEILTAIDEPNFQRLERPECCPEQYYATMLECWAHDPSARPKFKDLNVRLRNIRPEQVIAKAASAQGEGRRNNLLNYRSGDKITVIGKEHLSKCNMWVGVLPNGACGLFNPETAMLYTTLSVVSPYKPSEDLEEMPLLSPNSPSHFTGGAATVPPFSMLTDETACEPIRTASVNLQRSEPSHSHDFGRTGEGSRIASKRHAFMQPSTSRSLISMVKSATLGKSFRHEDKITSMLKAAEPTHEYQEIDNEASLVEMPTSENLVLRRSQTDFSQSLIDEMECMFQSLNVPPTGSVLLKKSGLPNQRAHTLGSFGKKKTHSEIVKPMSAHEQKTLETAVALANELTTRSMNDLDAKSEKVPASPNERSKFHFKFPSISHPHSSQEQVKEAHVKVERRNFSQEAQSVPDLQSTITEESRLAYASLIEQPTPSSLITHIAQERANDLEPSVALGQQVGLSHRSSKRCHDSGKPATGHLSSDRTDAESNNEVVNVLPLPSKGSKPQMVDKTRHIRIHPLVITDSMRQKCNMEVKVVQPQPDEPPSWQRVQESIAKNHEYQNFNSKSPVYSKKTTVMDPNSYFVQKCLPEPNYMNIYVNTGIDVCDGPAPRTECTQLSGHILEVMNKDKMCEGKSVPEPSIEESDKAGPSSENLTANKRHEHGITAPVLGSLLKDSPDHVSVEDLLEFADQKPCGRQRGAESDEVRILCKVLPKVTEEECLEVLDHTEWKIHAALKLFHVRAELGNRVSLRECSRAIAVTGGDLGQAASLLRLGKPASE